jgi:hypothetical protein
LYSFFPLFSGPFAAAANLNIAKPGSGSGVIASSPAGINCGADCTGSYPNGTAVTLTATPGRRFLFELLAVGYWSLRRTKPHLCAQYHGQ